MYKHLATLCFLTSTLSIGCAPEGKHIHVASATAADLQAAKGEDSVWYEFRPGDTVPFQFLVFGDAVSAGPPTKLVAKKQFWIILSKGRQLQFSYDGKSANAQDLEFILSVAPTPEGGAQVIWLNHLGTGNAKTALEEFLGPETTSADASPPSQDDSVASNE